MYSCLSLVFKNVVAVVQILRPWPYADPCAGGQCKLLEFVEGFGCGVAEYSNSNGGWVNHHQAVLPNPVLPNNGDCSTVFSTPADAYYDEQQW